MSIAKHHAEWLSLIEVSGPFLSLPVLVQKFPQGLDNHDPDHFRLLRQVHEEWEDNQRGEKPDRAIHNQWIKWNLCNTLDLEEALVEGQDIPQTLKSELPEHGETLRPDMVVMRPGGEKPRLLIQTYPFKQGLSRVVEGKPWKASPDTRMMQLLHDTDVRLGLVTNGDRWMLVDAPKGETTGYASWYSTLWLEEPKTLQAFRDFLGCHRFFDRPEDETLESLLAQSAEDQQEVTDQLGYQVRRAVEVLVQSLDKADRSHGGTLLSDVPEERLYESALTVMMRLVFLFCAEERELLLLGDELYDKNYAVSTLREQLRTTADNHGEEILGTREDAWSRLLTTFRAMYGGVQHERMKLPAYGGDLFDPDRFPFLEGRKRGTSWKEMQSEPLPINNRTVLHLLEALQVLQVKLPGGGAAEPRKLSFRALGIEQIGHVYEGLLDHTAKRATEPVLGLRGTRNNEPEIPLSELEELAAKDEKELHKLLKKQTGRSSVSPIKKMLAAELDDLTVSRFRTACQNDEEFWQRVKPFAGLVRTDTFDYPVVIPKGSVFVTAGTDRRSSGTHYTPRSLTEPIVQYTLEPLVYEGPAEGKPKEEWRLKSPADLLELNICDMACGSGAFLVQACRYMSERMLEAWEKAEKQIDGSPRITPTGDVSKGGPEEQLIPVDTEERLVYARRIVAARCLYGVDVNPLAAEMAKLSLWLLTLAKDKPFEFLDHAIRCGDSLVGLHDLEQLRHYSLTPDDDDAVLFKGPLDSDVDETINLRLELENMPANTIKDVEAQERLLAKAEDKVARLRCAADLLVAAELWGENAKDKQEKVRHAAVVSGHYIDNGPTHEFKQKAANECRGQRMFHWPLEFPEVFAQGDDSSVKKLRFDAVIGNPPFLPITQLAWDVRRYIESQYSCAVGRHNTFSSFAERSLAITSNRGSIGLVVPDRLFLNVQYDLLRSLLFSTLTFSNIIDFSGAFNATVDTIAIIGHKIRTDETIKVVHRVGDNGDLKEKEFVQSSLLTAFDGAINIYVEPEDSDVYAVAKSQSVALGDIAEVKDGIIQGAVADLLFLDEPLDGSSRKLLFGRDVERYQITWNQKYVNYKPDELLEVEVDRRGPGVRPGLWMRNSGIFERPKILTRQTSDRLIGAVDVNNHYYANTLHGISLNDEGNEGGFSLHYILAILNSQLMNYVYAIITGEVGKVFAQIKIDTLKKLPIFRRPKDSIAQELTALAIEAEKVASGKRADIKEEIDQRVFDLYGIQGHTREYVQMRTLVLFGE